MASQESTAINSLLDLLATRPVPRQDDDELLFEVPSIATSPRVVRLASVPPVVTPPAALRSIVASPIAASRRPVHATHAPRATQMTDEYLEATIPVRRVRAAPAIGSVVVPIVAFATLGILIGIYLGLGGSGRAQGLRAMAAAAATSEIDQTPATIEAPALHPTAVAPVAVTVTPIVEPASAVASAAATIPPAPAATIPSAPAATVPPAPAARPAHAHHAAKHHAKSGHHANPR